MFRWLRRVLRRRMHPIEETSAEVFTQVAQNCPHYLLLLFFLQKWEKRFAVAYMIVGWHGIALVYYLTQYKGFKAGDETLGIKNLYMIMKLHY